jgi:hypothetical protein
LVRVLWGYSFELENSSVLNDLLSSYCIQKKDFEYYVEKLRRLLRRKEAKRLLRERTQAAKRLLRERTEATKRLLRRLKRRLAKSRKAQML